jgi:hypothetical protein
MQAAWICGKLSFGYFEGVYLDAILGGCKTIEPRFARTKPSWFSKIEVGN